VNGTVCNKAMQRCGNCMNLHSLEGWKMTIEQFCIKNVDIEPVKKRLLGHFHCFSTNKLFIVFQLI
jgi:hypothetical protein